ncbi:MAG: MMPL family transporter [Pseudolysinimonas sp.]
MAKLLSRLGLLAAHRPLAVLGGWLAVLAIAVGAFLMSGGGLAASLSIPGTPTAVINDRVAEKLPDLGGASGTVVFQTSDGVAFDADQRAAISDVLDGLTDLPGVDSIVDPFVTDADRAAQQQQLDGAIAALGSATPELVAAQQLLDAARDIRTVSGDGATAIGVVVFHGQLFDLAPEVKAAVAAALDDAKIPGVTVDYSTEIAASTAGLIGPGEIIGVIIASIVLVIMLRSLLPTLIPLVSSLIGVGVGVAGSLAFSGVVDMTSVTPVLGVMLGLAVGIDYSLFIINRHRRQLRLGMPLRESIGLANGTAGNAVVFAGLTVTVALLALNVTGIPFLAVMGTVGAVCVLIAVMIAVTLTPALLRLIGTRVLSRRERTDATSASRPEKIARPMRTPAAVAVLAAAVIGLLIVAVPALSMRLGLPDGSSEPTDSTQYRAYSIVADEFGAGQNGPLLFVAEPADPVFDEAAVALQADVTEWLMAQNDVVAVAPVGVSADGDFFAFQVVPGDGPSSVSTEQLVNDLRSHDTILDGIQIGVAGQASGNIDISAKLAGVLPLYLGLVIGLSLIIMTIVFRSLLVPLIATGGFVLSLFAALGAVTAVFQWGWLGAVFGVHDPGPILNFAPIILIGVLFGLAMDYQLFLVSGMREAYVHGLPARTAVVVGRRGGRAVVTAAAIIMASVFGGFVFSHLTMVRPLGFGLAIGVLFDAFVVRMLIVPALMHLAGDKAWWLPRWLDRILPDVDVEGAALERTHTSQFVTQGEHRRTPA